MSQPTSVVNAVLARFEACSMEVNRYDIRMRIYGEDWEVDMARALAEQAELFEWLAREQEAIQMENEE